MSAPVFSERWYRVSDLQPRLPPTVRVRRQVVRGQVWRVLSGGPAQPLHRLNASGWALVGRCDGRRTVDAIWGAIVAANADDSPTQDEIISLLTQLHAAELIEFDRINDLEVLRERRRQRQRKERRARLNPLSFRLPLGSPGALLDRLAGVQALVFSRVGLALWLILVLAGLFTLAAQWDAATEHAARWLNTPRYLLIAWLCYPLMKLVHELSHALAIRRWGGEVREIGLGLMMLTPIPYVDASDAALLSSRVQRCWVSAAGICAELALAAIGLIAWAGLEPGFARDMMFSLALIGGVSTLALNANPLMRLDGYYLLCDALQLPNLASRSAAWWQSAIARYLLGLTYRAPPASLPGERGWLVAYAPLTLVYRVLTAAWLVWWAGSTHPLLGLIAAILVIGLMLALPLVRSVLALLRDVPADHRRHAARARLIAALAVIVLAVIAVPLPDRLAAQGVVWLPEQSHLRAATAGFLVGLAPDGAPMHHGDQVAALSAMEIDTEWQRLSERRAGLETALYQTLVADAYKSRQIADSMAELDNRLALLEQRRAGLSIRAGTDGSLAVARPQDQPGRFVHQGDDIGFIRTRAPTLVRVAVPQEDAARLAAAAVTPQVRLAQYRGASYEGRVLRIEPAANDRLPSAALSASVDGDIVTDPTDHDNLRPVRPVRLIDVEVAALDQSALGGRAWVRFDFGQASIASQVGRYLRQQVLVRFSPFES